MAEQSSFMRIAVPVSAIVVAVCAAVVTVKALTGGIQIQQQRVLDPTAVAQQVADQATLSGQGTNLKAACPVSIPVVSGTKFRCAILKDGSHSADVTVTILNDQGELSVSSA
jgi:hypothetical protein